MDPQGEVTSLLVAWGKGDQNALNELMPLVYNELHRMARRAWGAQDQGNTLQPTALINEAYLRLAGRRECLVSESRPFLRRRLHSDAADPGQSCSKPPCRKARQWSSAVSLDDVQLAVHQEAAEVVALHDALERLQAVDERKSKVIEMRYFGGLSIEETAEALGVSIITVNRDWRLARTWLMREMNGEQAMTSKAEWEEIERLFHEVVDLPAQERQALLVSARAPVRAEVESLLKTDDEAVFVERPVASGRGPAGVSAERAFRRRAHRGVPNRVSDHCRRNGRGLPGAQSIGNSGRPEDPAPSSCLKSAGHRPLPD